MSINITVQYKCDLGKAVYIASNQNNWQPIRLEWTKDDFWIFRGNYENFCQKMPQEYKFCVADYNNSNSGQIWESCPNRKTYISPHYTCGSLGEPATTQIADVWNAPNQSKRHN